MNATSFLLVNLEQGTDDWHAWRRQGIGASDAPTIMVENPWKSPEDRGFACPITDFWGTPDC